MVCCHPNCSTPHIEKVAGIMYMMDLSFYLFSRTTPSMQIPWQSHTLAFRRIGSGLPCKHIISKCDSTVSLKLTITVRGVVGSMLVLMAKGWLNIDTSDDSLDDIIRFVFLLDGSTVLMQWICFVSLLYHLFCIPIGWSSCSYFV